MICISFLLILLSPIYAYHEALLKEVANLYIPDASIDDVNSIAIDIDNMHIYATNTGSGTINIISYDLDNGLLQIKREIDIRHQSSPYFELDYITSITYSSKGYMIASLIPLNYAQNTGWLVFIDINTMYIDNFIELKYCFSPKYVVTTNCGSKVLVACEGLDDPDIDDPEGSISIIDIKSNDATKWKIYNVGFTDFDDCDDEENHKHLASGIYKQKPMEVFSINAEPEYITIDDNDHYAYITLQENNGVAILDIDKLEIIEIFSFGAHDFGFSGLDASDRYNNINIKAYQNLYGLRQPDGITYYKTKNGKQYVLTANEGNNKYYDVLRVNQIELDSEAFIDGNILKKDENLGRLQILNGGKEYGDDGSGTFNKLYTFGSRDFTIWEIESSKNVNCPCDYPYGLKLSFSSYDDFEHITAFDLGLNGFNSDRYTPSSFKRSDNKGPEPESIIVGECSNGDVFAFIGLERVGGIMVYDITGIEVGNAYFVEYLNSRDFTVQYDEDTRPPSNAGDVEPETLIFISDTDTSSPGLALLIVGYKTSSSIGVYSFDCAQHTDYTTEDTSNEHPTTIDDIPRTVDECPDQAPCLDIDIRPVIIEESMNSVNIIHADGPSDSYSVSDDNSDSGSDSNNDGDSDSSDSMGRSPSNSDSDSGSDSNLDGNSDSSDEIDISHSMDPSDSDSDSNNDGNSDSSDEEESNLNIKQMYIVCISFDIKNPYCIKEDIYFMYGVSLEDEEKQDAAALMPWYQGNKRCEIVECSSFARFAVRDGEGCGNSKALATSIDSVDYITCQQTERGSCRWKIPTPICRMPVVDNNNNNNNGDGSNTQDPANNGDNIETTTTRTTTTALPTTITTTTTSDTSEGSGGDYFGDYHWKPDGVNFQKPEIMEKSDYASRCNEQESCLKIEISDYDENGVEEYAICMYWDSITNECNKKKDVPFFESCTGRHDEDKIYRWKSGIYNKMCQVISCGDYGIFDIKDGSCTDSEFEGILDGVDDVMCTVSYGGYISDSCSWSIPAPQCINKYSNNRDRDDGDYQNQEDNDKKESRSAFDTMTNKGGHFYESTMFYILLAMSILTCFCIIGCVVKHSRKRNGETHHVDDDDNDDDDDDDIDGDGIGGDGVGDGINAFDDDDDDDIDGDGIGGDGVGDGINAFDDDDEHAIDTLEFQE